MVMVMVILVVFLQAVAGSAVAIFLRRVMMFAVVVLFLSVVVGDEDVGDGGG